MFAILMVSLVGSLATEVAADRLVVDREVSPEVAERLKLAAKAIRFVKRAIPHAGNQHEGVYATEGNSYYRKEATRNTLILDRLSWVKKPLAILDPLAAGTATIACTKGGSCGEHAELAMHFLAGLDSGQTITRAGIKGVDHAFVLIGDLDKDPLHEIVVVDAWVTSPQPLLYSDFSFKKSRKKILRHGVATRLGHKTRQTRRVLTRALRKSFVSNPEPLLEKTSDDPKTLPGLWYLAHASNADYRYVVKTKAGKRALRFTSAKVLPPITSEAQVRRALRYQRKQPARLERMRSAGRQRGVRK